jgi:ABC-type phosphate transport system substrate-binding protein
MSNVQQRFSARFSTSVALAAVALAGVTTARAEVVVIVNAKHPAAAMSAEQIANVYLGKDGSFAPLDLPESAPLRGEFYQKIAGKDAAQLKAMWARLIFTGKAQPPKQVGNSAEAVKQVAGNDRAIAYVDKSAVDASVKAVLRID